MESWERDPDAADVAAPDDAREPADPDTSAPLGPEPRGESGSASSEAPHRPASTPEAVLPVGRDDDPVAVDPLPSTGSLRWADDPSVPARDAAVGRPAVDSEPARRVAPHVPHADPVSAPVSAPVDPWGPPTGPPFPSASAAAARAAETEPPGDSGRGLSSRGDADRTDDPTARSSDSSPPTHDRTVGTTPEATADPWAPPTGVPLGAAPAPSSDRPPASTAGLGRSPTPAPMYGFEAAAGADAAPPGGRRHTTEPRHAVGARQRSETIVLAAVGTVVVVVGVAAMALGGGDGDGLPRTTEPPVTTTLALAGDGSDPTGPIVGSTGIVGWWSGSGWVPRDEGVPPEGSVDLTVVDLSGATSTARGTTVGEECASQRATAEFDLAVDLPTDGGPPPVAVAGVPQPHPRPVEWIAEAGATYQQAAAEVAAGLGAATPPTATATMRGDFDGGGTDEVVVVAEHLADPEAPAAGDWSVVFLRRVVADGVATDIVASSVAGAGGDGFERVRLSGVADLNVDGAMELVVDAAGDGTRWTVVHTVGAGGVPAEVLREGCDG